MLQSAADVVNWTQLTAVDVAVLSIVGLSMLVSLWRGFTREAVSLAGWVAAFVLANIYVANMATLLSGVLSNITARYVAGYAILFIGTLVIATLVARLGAQAVKATGLTLLDRILGTVFGLARGIIIVLVLLYVVRQLVPPQELQWLHQSQLIPYLDMLVHWVQMVFHDIRSGGGTTA